MVTKAAMRQGVAFRLGGPVPAEELYVFLSLCFLFPFFMSLSGV